MILDRTGERDWDEPGKRRLIIHLLLEKSNRLRALQISGAEIRRIDGFLTKKSSAGYT